MFSSVTRKLILLFLMAFFVFSVNAQKSHFIYLQTEGGQPFYVKFNNKLISSSSEGYVIIPGVTDGEYNLAVGFPRNEFPEEDYKIAVDNNEGYLLKNFGEKGWQLFNMQTLALITGTFNKLNPVVVKKDEDPFTKMLASVVKDSSILQNHDTISVATAKKADTSNNVNADTSIAITNESQHGWKISPPLSASDSSKVKNEMPPSVNKQDSITITRVLDKNDKDGLQMIYEVKSDSSKTDTVRIYMPLQKNQADSSNVKSVISENKNIPSVIDSSQLAIKPLEPKSQNDSSVATPMQGPEIDTTKRNNSLVNNNEKEVLQNSAPANSPIDSATLVKDSIAEKNAEDKKNAVAAELLNKTESTKETNTKETKDSTSSDGNQNISQIKISDVAQEKPKNKTQNGPPESQLIVLPKVVTTSRVNSDCKNFATTEDFFKLRKRMAAAIDRDDMIKVAKKYFKSKCYSTAQIKDLSYLFLTDEGKYKFFDEAYPFTSDSDQFPTLQSQFTDKYYLNRFKAMIGK